MSIRSKIVDLLGRCRDKMTMAEIYEHFPEIMKSTIRGRVYQSLGRGITRVGKNLYISSEAIVEFGDSLQVVDRMLEEGDTFDMIFLDIPYQAGGTKGGKRTDGIPKKNLFELGTISPVEFDKFVGKLYQMLSNEDASLVFMFTSGRSSTKEHDAYLKPIHTLGLKQCAFGAYEKLWPNGRPMNMGKYPMPKENIYVFSKSGNTVEADLNYSMVPDFKEYPTAKPYEMIRSIVDQLSDLGHWVFDPFGGSGKVLRACIELGRKCHIVDNNPASISMMVKLQ